MTNLNDYISESILGSTQTGKELVSLHMLKRLVELCDENDSFNLIIKEFPEFEIKKDEMSELNKLFNMKLYLNRDSYDTEGREDPEDIYTFYSMTIFDSPLQEGVIVHFYNTNRMFTYNDDRKTMQKFRNTKFFKRISNYLLENEFVDRENSLHDEIYFQRLEDKKVMDNI